MLAPDFPRKPEAGLSQQRLGPGHLEYSPLSPSRVLQAGSLGGNAEQITRVAPLGMRQWVLGESLFLPGLQPLSEGKQLPFSDRMAAASQPEGRFMEI